MKRLYVAEIVDNNVCSLADALREIANRVDDGYTSGITYNGTCWDIEDDDIEDDDI